MSQVLILSEHDVEELLTMRECIDVMEGALTALARGEIHNPLRHGIRPPGQPSLLGLMPAWRGGEKPYYGLKEVCVFPGNPRRGLDSHLGAVILHSGETGEPLAFMNASAITAIRTAAVSALATRILAREEAGVLAILGAGVQAKAHLRSIPLVRNVREVRVYSPRGAESLLETDTTGVVRAVDGAEAAVRGADLIVTASSSTTPILELEWIGPGAHINAVGSSVRTSRELDGRTIAACSLFVDRRESTVNESGDYLSAVAEGAIGGPDHIRAEIGEILTGAAEGRKSNDEITLFKSLGLAAEDLSAAAFLYEKAEREGRGVRVDF